MEVKIKFEGQKFVDDFTKNVAPEAIEAAQKDAINRTIKKAMTKTVRNISLSSGVKPLRIIKKRVKRFLINRTRRSAGIYFHWEPLPLEALGAIKWSRFMPGARVGRKSYAGTFAATPKRGKHTGRKRVYVRDSKTGENRQDLHAQYIILEKFKTIPIRVGANLVSSDLRPEFVSQLRYRLKKMGYIR